jgi:hypothetical protein
MRITPSAWRRSANGILVAGRQLPDAEEADQGLELVGERHARPTAARQRVAGEARLVVGLDGLGDGGCSPSASA